MSHFSVLVCLPASTALEHLESRLADVMAPWDETLSVAPYRVYEEGSPDDHWWVSALRRGASHHRALADLGVEAFVERRVAQLREQRQPWLRDLNEAVHEWVERNAAQWAEDAEWASRLPDPLSWESVVQLYNARHYPPDALAVTGHHLVTDDSMRLHYDTQTGVAYTLSTRNPDSKWDYWSIGGRWRGHFIAKRPGPGLISTPEQWDSPAEPVDQRGHCDGGPKSLLDFEAMRDKAATLAHERYDQWEAICEGTPVAKPWSHFLGLVTAGIITIDDAREQYGDQPRISKASIALGFAWGCVVEEFLHDRAEYVSQAQAAAIPGYAMVTLDRRWIAPGQMGWFGMSSDGVGEREAYNAEVNRYLDGLQDDDYVVIVDCHT